MPAGPVRAPCDVVNAVRHRAVHQLVIGGVEPRFIKAAAITVETDEFGRMAIGDIAGVEQLLAPCFPSQCVQRGVQPDTAFAFD